MDDDSNKPNWLTILIVAAIVGGIVALINKPDKYEGQTAEEWFNQYDYWYEKYHSFRSCVEDYDNFDIKTKLSYDGVFYYCE